MKSDSKPITVKLGRSDVSFTHPLHSSSQSSATKNKRSTRRQMLSVPPTSEYNRLKTDLPRQYLSKSLEKTFLRMKSKPGSRAAYVEAETVTALAHQIRAIRIQRGWTQGELAKKLGTTQAAISRLEDPSYGKFALSTLLELARVFDAGMQLRFVSFVSMLSETFIPSAKARAVPSFEEEAPTVDFYRPSRSTSSTLTVTNCEHGHSELNRIFRVDAPSAAASGFKLIAR